MTLTVKVTTASGNHWTTPINVANFAEAEDYFMNQLHTVIKEDFETGKETYDRITKVERI